MSADSKNASFGFAQDRSTELRNRATGGVSTSDSGYCFARGQHAVERCDR